jgi:hypothetical protein
MSSIKEGELVLNNDGNLSESSIIDLINLPIFIS